MELQQTQCSLILGPARKLYDGITLECRLSKDHCSRVAIVFDKVCDKGKGGMVGVFLILPATTHKLVQQKCLQHSECTTTSFHY